MKLLHVIPAIAARYGGPSAAVAGMCRALRAIGHDVLLVTTDADGHRGRLAPGDEQLQLSGVQVAMFRRQASESFKWSAPLARWLNEHVAAFDAVHIHAIFSHAALAAARACRRSGVPYLIRPLGTLDPWSLSRHRWRKQVLLQVGGRAALEHASLIHFTTDDEERLARQALPWLPAGVVVPLGVDDEIWSAIDRCGRTDGPPYVVALSRLDEKKGIDVLIRAFHHAAQHPSMRDVRLVVAGDGRPEYVAWLRQIADAGPGRDRIEFRGWVGGEARVPLLVNAALFALPSHQENFGISVAEAMACGTPVLISPSVNLAGAVAQASAGWVCDRSPEALASSLTSAMDDAMERRRRGAAARRLAEQFRWSVVARALSQVYQSVVERQEQADAPSLQAPVARREGSAH